MRNFIIYISLLVVTLLSLASCAGKGKNTAHVNVKYYGAMKTIMSGDISAKISLDSLSDKKNLYALGAIENLKGEIQIFDGEASNSSVIDKVLEINNSFKAEAALFVYAQVNEWTSFQIQSKTMSDLEHEILEIAKTNGIDSESPFPFLLEGQASSIHWHVINWKDGDTIHSHVKHKQSGLNGTLTHKTVQIIGFYSLKHKGIFTHHTSNMHMHFKLNDNSVAGHVDDLELNGNMILKLPKR